MRLGSLRTFFGTQIDEVDSRLAEYLDSITQTPSHYDMIRYHLGVQGERLSRGKRLRAIFCLLIGRAANADMEALNTLMVAIEMAHSASLVHDDIQDGETMRWGRPTVWAKFGEAQAINVGDSMIAMVYQVLLRLSEFIPHARAFKIIQLFNRAHLRMAEGQHLDMLFEGRIDIDVDSYLDMISRKTAATCECAAHAAAIAAGLDDREEAFRRFGEAFGMLYQVADDINDVWNDSGETGKTELSDLERGKATLPFLLGYERGSQRLRAILGGSGNITDADATVVRDEMTRLGVDRLCREYVARYRDESLAALEEACGGSVEFHMLARMTEMCAERAGVAASGEDSVQAA